MLLCYVTVLKLMEHHSNIDWTVVFGDVKCCVGDVEWSDVVLNNVMLRNGTGGSVRVTFGAVSLSHGMVNDV